MRSNHCFFIIVLLLLAVGPAAAADSTPDAATAHASVTSLIKPCAADSAELRDAKALLEAADARIAALGPTADAKSIVEELRRLAESPCFDLGGRFTGTPDSALSLKEYWEGGGREWIDSYLGLGVPDRPLWLWQEPSLARTLSRESAPQHALAPLLCKTADQACIDETRAFKARAMRSFAVQAERAALEAWQRSAHDDGAPPPVGFDECVARAQLRPQHERFRAFEVCLAQSEPKTLSFPLVGLMRPKDGWLRISGRRGHYAFCDEERAYDLKTGSAYIVSSCSSLALSEAGQVDARATDASRAVQTRTGWLPREALAELTWFLLIAPELEERAASYGRPLPAGIEPIASDAGEAQGFGLTFCGSSGDTTLHWSYTLQGRELSAGSFIWPGCGLAEPHHYLVGLLEVAELGLIDGCPSVAPPSPARRGPLSASALDADAASLSRAQQDLERGFRVALARCRSKARAHASSSLRGAEDPRFRSH